MLRRINRRHQFRAKWSVYYLLGWVVILTFLSFSYQHLTAEWKIAAASEDLTVVRAAAHQVRDLSEENQALEKELEAYKAKYPTPTREEIEAYVRKIFGRDANVALAVSHHECGYTNKNYPRCHLKSGVEHSVGLFQINLYNSKQWIHAGRIPGNTMEEKVLWLENPFNNTLYAYWVFKTSGFHPWTAYSKGTYLNDPLMK